MEKWGTQRYKKVLTIWQILMAKPKLWKRNQCMYQCKNHLFFLLKSGEMLSAVPKNGQFYKYSHKKLYTFFASWFKVFFFGFGGKLNVLIKHLMFVAKLLNNTLEIFFLTNLKTSPSREIIILVVMILGDSI